MKPANVCIIALAFVFATSASASLIYEESGIGTGYNLLMPFSYKLHHGVPTPTLIAGQIFTAELTIDGPSVDYFNVDGLLGYDYHYLENGVFTGGSDGFFPSLAQRITPNLWRYSVTAVDEVIGGGRFTQERRSALVGMWITPKSNNSGPQYSYRMTITGPVPEPATWAMMMGGFALAGTAVRRRTRAKIVTA